MNLMKQNLMKLVKISMQRSRWTFYFHQANKHQAHYLSGAIIDLGVNARSWMGWQIPIITDNNHTLSQIKGIATDEIKKFISKRGSTQ